MHVARGGWLGQTFALAKYGDSFDGKKSGIRRSKEERKGMVETFIKRCFHASLFFGLINKVYTHTHVLEMVFK